MGKFVIEGNRKLGGNIEPQGAKNEALQVISATLLSPEEITISNIPDISDVNNLIKLVSNLGVEVTKNSPGSYTFKAGRVDPSFLDSHSSERGPEIETVKHKRQSGFQWIEGPAQALSR